MSTIQQRLASLRAQMRQHKLAGYIVPTSDPHQGEYVSPHWQRRQWLSGFTGSNGDLIVTLDEAGLWTDGRYFIQAEAQLSGSSIQLFKPGLPRVPSQPEWLAKQVSRGQSVGIDAQLLTPALAKRFQRKLRSAGVKLRPIDANLVDAIWQDRPAAPQSPVELQRSPFSGETASSKLKRLRRSLEKAHADAHILTGLDAIAWLFNIRGQDVPFVPVNIAYAVVTMTDATLFIDHEKLSKSIARKLKQDLKLTEYDRFGAALTRLKKRSNQRIWVDQSGANEWILSQLKPTTILLEPSPIWRMKSKKNRTEIDGAKRAHLRDGVALVNFFAWLDAQLSSNTVTECSAAAKLRQFRAEGRHFRGESFHPISAFGAHGAIIHYAADPTTDSGLKPSSLYLIDSGGQYQDGTTDVTRTVSLRPDPTRTQRHHYTHVLKAHLALARCRFPAGTSGVQLDAIARGPLWAHGFNYRHGTGHGVGSYLSVHEGPQSLHAGRQPVPLEEGNILSNEPGLYVEGQYGIRIENLMYVREDPKLANREDRWLGFGQLTLCPYDRRLIAKTLLTDDELKWLNDYHAWISRLLMPRLSGRSAVWLRHATRRL